MIMIFLIVLILLLLPLRVDAVIAVANSVSASADGVSFITTSNITSAASGSLFICDGAAYAPGATSVDITDSKSNAYTRPIYIGNAYDGQVQGGQWYKENGAGGASHNFTFTYDVTSDLAVACKEVTGALTSGALDKSAYKEDNIGTATGLTSNSTATTSQNDELFSGLGALYLVGAPTSFTAQSGFTENREENTSSQSLVSASKVVTSTQAAEFTFDASQEGFTLAWVTTWKATTTAATFARRRIISGD